MMEIGPLYLGGERVRIYRPRRRRHQLGWTERLAILACQVAIPAGIVLRGAAALLVFVGGFYLLFLFGGPLLRRLGGCS